MVLLVRILLILTPVFSSFKLLAQNGVDGIVFDRDTGQRVGKVLLTNLSTQESIFNNARGEFNLAIKKGDILVSTKDNYYKDTLVYTGQDVLIIKLKRATIYIDPVSVVARKTPDQILQERKRDYSRAYSLAGPNNLISVGDNGAGLSIGAIYNYFSREGRNARRLTQFFQQEFEDNYIDMRFTKELVRSVTGLEGEALDNFMLRYRPTYEFVTLANNYQLISYIKSKYEFFKYIPYIKPLPDLRDFNLLPK